MTGYGAFWSRNGVLFETAAAATVGPSESFPAIAAAGYGWVAFDPKTGNWEDERRLAQQNDLDMVAWTRVRAQADLDVLYRASHRWPACKAIIPNLESPDVRISELMVASALLLSRVGRGLVVSDGWLDSLGFWKPLRRWVLAVECFPQADPRLEDVAGCLEHAEKFSTRPAVACLGAYGTGWKGRLPVLSDYAVPAGVPHMLFLGDNVASWGSW